MPREAQYLEAVYAPDTEKVLPVEDALRRDQSRQFVVDQAFRSAPATPDGVCACLSRSFLK